MKRLILALLIVTLVVPLFAACGPAATPTLAPTPTPKTVTIIFYQRGYVEGGTDAGTVNTTKEVEIFQKNNPNIKVNIVGIPWTAEGDTKLEAALAAKTDINVFRVTSPNLPR